ncbi:hypothetical protein evm_003011 [Chilo suppressalis]|nr:hypothetical protein evm_003011 [Chilo suppressalis]
MVNSCCVTGCYNESYPGSPFSFHGFPKNEKQKLMWENAVPGKISDESHELELIRCIGQKYINLRLRSYRKSLTLEHVRHKASLRQKLRKIILFSNV